MQEHRAPDSEIKMTFQTVEALMAESERPGIELHRRFIQARERGRVVSTESLLDHIDGLFQATA